MEQVFFWIQICGKGPNITFYVIFLTTFKDKYLRQKVEFWEYNDRNHEFVVTNSRQWSSRDGTNIQNPFSLEKVISETEVQSSQNATKLTLEQISCIIMVAFFLIYSKL